MAIHSSIIRTAVYEGDGHQTDFPFPFRVFDKRTDSVTCTIWRDGEEERLLSHDEYHIEADWKQRSEHGGFVRLNAPLESGQKMIIRSNAYYHQPIHFSNQGGFYPEVLNEGLDRVSTLIFQLLEHCNRTFYMPLSFDGSYSTALPEPKDGGGLSWVKKDGVFKLQTDDNPSKLEGLVVEVARIDGEAARIGNLLEQVKQVTMEHRERLNALEGASPPSGKEQTGLWRELFDHAEFMKQGGRYKFDPWISETIGGYAVGAILQSSDSLKLYANKIAGNKTNPDSPQADGWMVISDNYLEVDTVSSIAKLRTYTGSSDSVHVQSYYEGGNVGGGLFHVDLSDRTSSDNGGTVIVSASGARWKRHDSVITPFDFGATGSEKRLAEVFSSLEAAQVVYPNATTLNDTLDVVAINQALRFCDVSMEKGQYYISRSIAIPSYRKLKGAGWETQINCTADMPRHAHMIVNSEGDYIVGGKSDNEVLRLVEGNRGNENIVVKDLYLRGDLDTAKEMTRSGVCFKHVKNSVISGVKTSWTGYHGIDIADASEGHLVDMAGYAHTWETKPSENVLVEKCFVEYHGDDGYTTHYSNDITFDRCLARYGAQIFSAENGFEIDDASRNCVITGCVAIFEQCGFVVKRHDKGMPSSGARLSNNVAQFCGTGYWFYGKQGIQDGVYSDAYAVQMSNCASMFARRHERISGRTIRDLLIQDFTGVQVDNFAVVGWNYDGKIKCADVSDYQPFYTDAQGVLQRVTAEMMPYSVQVLSGGKDVTTDTSVNIFVDANSRGVTIDGVLLLGARASNAHIYTQAAAKGVRGVSVSNVRAIDCSGGDVVGMPSDAPEHSSVADVYAESRFDVAGKHVFRASSYTNIIKRVHLSNIRGRDYASNIKLGNAAANFTGLSNGHATVASADTGQPPVAAVQTNEVASWLALSNYDNLMYQIDSVANAFRHAVKSGKAIWFGHHDGGEVSNKFGLHANGNLIPYTTSSISLGQSTNVWAGVFTEKTVYPGGVADYCGSGSPEGRIAAPVGSTYRRSDGGRGTTFYVKESGSGNGGWVAK